VCSARPSGSFAPDTAVAKEVIVRWLAAGELRHGSAYRDDQDLNLIGPIVNDRGFASRGLRTPRSASGRMNDIAARRKGRWRGARQVGPPYVEAAGARRATGSSRSAAT
jgi:hypothetical protein